MAFRQSLSLLKEPRYGTFWVSSFLANLGTWVQQVAQPWLMLSLTNSSFMLGLDAFAMDAPMWGLTLLGGALADRADRRRVIFICQSIQALCPVLLVVLLLFDHVNPFVIIGCSLVIGVTDALSMPSFSSIVPSIVERNQIGAGIALKSMQFNVSRIIGPAIAGVLLTGAGAAACFSVSALSYVPFVLVAWLVLPKFTPPPETARTPLLTGVKEIIAQPMLRGCLQTALVTGLFCSPIVTFCPVLVKEGFKAGPEFFSAALGGFGVGGVLGAIALLTIEGRYDRRALSSRAGVIYGLLVLAAGATPSVWLVPVVMAGAGVAMSFSNTQANSVLQLESGARRGQAASLFMLSMRGGLSIGALVTGAIATWLGIRWALAINGALAMGLHLWVGQRWLAVKTAD
ncbi:MAG: MFS transporter [Archangium sp.]